MFSILKQSFQVDSQKSDSDRKSIWASEGLQGWGVSGAKSMPGSPSSAVLPQPHAHVDSTDAGPSAVRRTDAGIFSEGTGFTGLAPRSVFSVLPHPPPAILAFLLLSSCTRHFGGPMLGPLLHGGETGVRLCATALLCPKVLKPSPGLSVCFPCRRSREDGLQVAGSVPGHRSLPLVVRALGSAHCAGSHAGHCLGCWTSRAEPWQDLSINTL